MDKSNFIKTSIDPSKVSRVVDASVDVGNATNVELLIAISKNGDDPRLGSAYSYAATKACSLITDANGKVLLDNMGSTSSLLSAIPDSTGAKELYYSEASGGNYKPFVAQKMGTAIESAVNGSWRIVASFPRSTLAGNTPAKPYPGGSVDLPEYDSKGIKKSDLKILVNSDSYWVEFAKLVAGALDQKISTESYDCIILGKQSVYRTDANGGTNSSGDYFRSQTDNLHMVTGRRRLIIGTANATISVPITGPGKDLFVAWVTPGSDATPGVVYWYEISTVRNAYSIPLNAKVEKGYHLNLIEGVLTNLTGITSSTAVESTLQIDNGSVVISAVNWSCDIGYGSLNSTFMRRYWSTGFGQLTKVTDSDKIDAALNTWDDHNPEGLNYAIKAVNCANRSLTETSFYRDYSRARKRACKDNDYMTLTYSDGLSMKEVESRLAAQQQRLVWVGQRYATNVSMSVSMATVAAGPNSTQFILTIPGGSSTTYSLDEAGIQSAVDSLPANVGLSDPSGILKGKLPTNSDGTYLAAGTGSYVTLSGSATATGAAIDYQTVIKVMSIDAQVSYLCSQVTTYRQIQSLVLNLINLCDFSSVSKVM